MDASQNREFQNPKLKALKELILDAFDNDENTLAILFTKTRVGTEALKSWAREDPDLNFLNAMRITGVSSEDEAGQ